MKRVRSEGEKTIVPCSEYILHFQEVTARVDYWYELHAQEDSVFCRHQITYASA